MNTGALMALNFVGGGLLATFATKNTIEGRGNGLQQGVALFGAGYSTAQVLLSRPGTMQFGAGLAGIAGTLAGVALGALLANRGAAGEALDGTRLRPTDGPTIVPGWEQSPWTNPHWPDGSVFDRIPGVGRQGPDDGGQAGRPHPGTVDADRTTPPPPVGSTDAGDGSIAGPPSGPDYVPYPPDGGPSWHDIDPGFTVGIPGAQNIDPGIVVGIPGAENIDPGIYAHPPRPYDERPPVTA